MRKKPGRAEQAPAVVAVDGRADGEHAVQRRHAAERRRAADGGAVEAAAHEGEPADEEPEHAQRVHQEVHRHRVGGVLGADQAGLDQREAGLHEHDQEAGDQRPDEVDREEAVRRRLRDGVDRDRELLGRRLVGIGLGVARHRVRGRRGLEGAGLVGHRVIGVSLRCGKQTDRCNGERAASDLLPPTGEDAKKWPYPYLVPSDALELDALWRLCFVDVRLRRSRPRLLPTAHALRVGTAPAPKTLLLSRTPQAAPNTAKTCITVKK